MNPNIIIISAPSGAGKTSLARKLVGRQPHLALAISHTTRAQRSGEIDGVDYHFISTDEFEKMISADEFVEYAKVFGNFYGTSLKSLNELVAKGKRVILQIDWQGARAVRAKFANTCTIFLVPPSLESLEQRLKSRRRDDAAAISARMQAAQSEMSHQDEYDHIVINDKFENALCDIEKIVLTAADNLL